jgi:hypothetical protein
MQKMNMRTCRIMGALIMATCLLVAARGFAQAPNKPAKEPVKAVTPAEVPSDSDKIGGYMIFVGAAGGYHVPTGNAGEMLDPNFGGKLFVQYYRSGGYPGIGLEGGTFFLKDADYDAGIYYVPIIPFGTLTFSLFSLMDIQVKIGSGVTVLVSEFNTGNRTIRNTSVDFTVDGGAAVMRSFFDHYVIGAEMDFFYMFERDASVLVSLYVFAGYQF